MLGYFYPSYLFVFQLLIALDISNHWIQIYSSLQHAAIGKTTHKVIDLWEYPVMKVYYFRPVLFIFCAGNELFFTSLYVLHFTSGSLSESLASLYFLTGAIVYWSILECHRAGVNKNVYMTCHFWNSGNMWLFTLNGLQAFLDVAELCIMCMCVCYAFMYAVSVFGYEIGVWTLLALLSFPLSFLKQCVSVAQLIVACLNIRGLDAVQRAR